MSEPSPDRFQIERLWQPQIPTRDYPLKVALIPAAGFFRIGVAVRHGFWRLFQRQAGIPIVSIGNLTVGGNSKTPFTLYLAVRLERLGYRVAIVSRGYASGKKKSKATLVALGGELKLPPEDAGDEPAMMARYFKGPIVIARRRIHGIELLKKLGAPDVVLLDDGFQHVRLARDVDLVLVSAEGGFGNGWMLPAGPMREPIRAARRANAVVIVSAGAGLPTALTRSQTLRLESATKVLHASVRPRALVISEKGEWREMPMPLASRRVLAVSGLANPAGFYAMLRELDADLVGVLEYPDHHAYSAADWQAIVTAARNADLVVTTEKDLVKLERFPFARDSLYALRLEVAMNDEDARALDELVVERIRSAAGDSVHT
ncbi:MAG TPA: tetraacyldisaccharide 4'-kinase [Candidatus Binataceae bacterium]|nr:tetraacyldisaccharide 4'-kinase [Candidatus Binataceae bacterium]